MKSLLLLLMVFSTGFEGEGLPPNPLAKDSYDAFLAKEKGWNPHPELANLHVGPGVLVIFKGDGRFIRYSGLLGSVHEVYEMAYPEGFVAEGGTWTQNEAGRLDLDFDRIGTSMVLLHVPPGRDIGSTLVAFNSCRAGRRVARGERQLWEHEVQAN